MFNYGMVIYDDNDDMMTMMVMMMLFDDNIIGDDNTLSIFIYTYLSNALFEQAR